MPRLLERIRKLHDLRTRIDYLSRFDNIQRYIFFITSNDTLRVNSEACPAPFAIRAFNFDAVVFQLALVLPRIASITTVLLPATCASFGAHFWILYGNSKFYRENSRVSPNQSGNFLCHERAKLANSNSED